MRKLDNGSAVTTITLPEKHLPDGLCWDARGRLYVATTYSHAVTVIDEDEIVGSYRCEGGAPTNCCIAGKTLITTDARRGALWRHQLDVGGLPLTSDDLN
jgi:sugar lactone lactonase YvrE